MWVERITTDCSPISLRKLGRHALGGMEPAVGSSTMMSEGPTTTVTAMPKRW
jgi:hypothetical protein